MDGEKEANNAGTPSSVEPADASDAVLKLEAGLEERKTEVQSLELEETTYEFTDVDLDSLSEEQLKARVELLDEQIEQAKKRIETNRRAVNIGLLKKANRAPRCSRLKKNGEPCRAPAVKGEPLCYYHLSAAETGRNPEMQIDVLEDRESMQITLKQVMEQVVSKQMSLGDARLLLRAIQIAGSMLKPEKKAVQPAKGKPASRETDEESGLTPRSEWG